MTHILFIDDDLTRRTQIAEQLREQGIDVTEQDSIATGTALDCDAVVAMDEAISADVAILSAQRPIILLSNSPTVKASVAALQSGAKYDLALPASTGDLMAAIERATAYSVRKPITVVEPIEMIGSSEVMNTLRQRIAKVGPTDSTVLILGQSGTGKELVARGIHAASHRSHAPLITLNCATVPPSLIES